MVHYRYDEQDMMYDAKVVRFSGNATEWNSSSFLQLKTENRLKLHRILIE